MTLKLYTRVLEYTSTAGTGNVVFNGTRTGYRTFGSVLSNGDTFPYCILDPINGDWEEGVGTFISGSNAMSRSVEQSSAAGAPINLVGRASTQVFLDVSSGLLRPFLLLAAVAYSGAYGDLSGRPSLAAVATSGAYGDLSGRPSLATVATSGAYSDLTGKPSFATIAFSGAYSDLSGAPTGMEFQVNRNAVNGYAGLDGNGYLALAQMQPDMPKVGIPIGYPGTLDVFSSGPPSVGQAVYVFNEKRAIPSNWAGTTQYFRRKPAANYVWNTTIIHSGTTTVCGGVTLSNAGSLTLPSFTGFNVAPGDVLLVDNYGTADLQIADGCINFMTTKLAG